MVSELHIDKTEIEMEEGELLMYEKILQTKCSQNAISLLIILKHYLLKLIFESASVYFVDYTFLI